MTELKYVGAGMGAAMVGIPARDLNAEEVKEFGGEAVLLAFRCADLPLYIKESQPRGRYEKPAPEEGDE